VFACPGNGDVEFAVQGGFALAQWSGRERLDKRELFFTAHSGRDDDDVPFRALETFHGVDLNPRVPFLFEGFADGVDLSAERCDDPYGFLIFVDSFQSFQKTHDQFDFFLVYPWLDFAVGGDKNEP